MQYLFRFFFFFKQKTAYEMRISDWSSDVCSSDLVGPGGAAPADPEKNTNFEIGMKAETADHKLQGSIVAFYTDYRNNQTLTIPPGALTTVIYNLPKATIKGIEAEFIARPFGGLSINGNVGLLWTKLDAPGDRKSTRLNSSN